MSVWQQMQKERLCLYLCQQNLLASGGFECLQLTFVCRASGQPCAALAPESLKEGNGCWHLIFIDPGAEKNLDRKAQRRACMVNLKCP